MSIVEMNDPNKCWGEKTFRLTFQCWDYRAVHEATVGGNCLGMSNLDSAVDEIYEKLVDGKGAARLVLTNADGDLLSCDDEMDDGSRWLMDMLVGAEIVKLDVSERAKRPEAGPSDA